jgi:hypothetical protein
MGPGSHVGFPISAKNKKMLKQVKEHQLPVTLV